MLAKPVKANSEEEKKRRDDFVRRSMSSWFLLQLFFCFTPIPLLMRPQKQQKKTRVYDKMLPLSSVRPPT